MLLHMQYRKRKQSLRMISENKFLGFGWPPKVPSYDFKQRPRYQHEVIYIGKNDPETAFVLIYPSEKKARAAVKCLREAANILQAGYERKELTPEDEGFHTAI